MTTVRRRKTARPQLDMTRVVESFRAFRQAKNAEAQAKSTYEKLRDEALMPVVEQFGAAHGETGVHRAIELPEPIDGFVRLVRRANTSESFDIDAAEKLAADKGILEEVQTVSLRMDGIPATMLGKLRELIAGTGLEDFAPVLVDVRLDQDKVYAAHARGQVTAEELDGLIITETRYSFFPEKA